MSARRNEDSARAIFGVHFKSLGTCSDAKLAELSGVSRTTIATYRELLCIPAFVKPARSLTEEQAEIATRELKAGRTLLFVSDSLHLPLNLIYQHAHAIGWEKNWRTFDPPKKVGRLTYETVIRRLRTQKETNRAIAKSAGVSSEYIRQVAARAGLESRRSIQKRIVAAKRKKRAKLLARRQLQRQRSQARTRARYLRKLERYLKRAQQMWDQGALIGSIAKKYRLTTHSMSWWIFRGRTELGWFARRA